MQYSDDEICTYIKSGVETPNLDYKVTASWDKDHKEDKLELTKDILAMANTRDGGKIIIGVDDKTKTLVGLSDEVYDSFEITKVNEFLHKYADPAFTCNVIKKDNLEDKKVVIIDVPEFQEVPIVCKDNGHDPENKLVLIKGGLYIRTAKCTSELVSSADEMRSILGRGLSKKSDELLSSIQKLMTGKPLREDANSEKQYETEFKEAEIFFNEKLDTSVGSWGISVYPTIYKSNRIKNPVEAGNIVTKSTVRLRGWDIPHSDRENISNFSKGKESFTDSKEWHEAEAWRMYKSGLFIWKELFREDLSRHYESYNQPVFDFVGLAYSVTEFMLFIKRVYTEAIDSDTIHIKILLNKCKNRRLIVDYPGTFNIHGHISNEEVIPVEHDIQTVNLQASFEKVARDFIREILMAFNWNDPDETMLESWQKKLIEKGG